MTLKHYRRALKWALLIVVYMIATVKIESAIPGALMAAAMWLVYVEDCDK